MGLSHDVYDALVNRDLHFLVVFRRDTPKHVVRDRWKSLSGLWDVVGRHAFQNSLLNNDRYPCYDLLRFG